MSAPGTVGGGVYYLRPYGRMHKGAFVFTSIVDPERFGVAPVPTKTKGGKMVHLGTSHAMAHQLVPMTVEQVVKHDPLLFCMRCYRTMANVVSIQADARAIIENTNHE